VEDLQYGATLSATPAHVTAERNLAAREVNIASGFKGGLERVRYGSEEREIGAINHEAIGRPVNKRYERHLQSVKSRVEQLGIMVATVVNFLPIRLVTDSVLDPLRHASITNRPPKDDQPYSTFYFEEVFYEPSVVSPDSPPIAVDQHPIILAQEFSKHDPGVFSFIGIPSDIEREDWKRKKSHEPQHGGMTYGQALEAKRQEAVEWMLRQVENGTEAHLRNIAWTVPQKAAARRLLALGHIKELPKGVDEVKDVQQVVPVCPKCQRRSEPGAVQCTNGNCAYVIDPRRAYEIGAIDEEHISLERLTRAEVMEMGISQYVAETRDEKIIRLKTPGATKPQSEVALRMLEADDDRKRMETTTLAAALRGTEPAREG
jgi:hypothetical protein